MLARSHFGDLQFLHGMALAGEEAATTRDNMLMWAEFTYRVGRGDIDVNTLIKDVANLLAGENKGRFAALFPPNIPVAQLTIQQFFGVKDGGPGDAKARAIGSLLHMVEDTFAESHTEREELEGGKVGRIISFHAFSGQKTGLHHQADVPSGPGKTTEEKILATPRAMQAVDAATRVLKMLKKLPWTTEVVAMFEDILGLAKHTTVAGPGGKFVADTLPTLSQFKADTKAGWWARRSSDSHLTTIDTDLKAYDKYRKDISKDKQKRALIVVTYYHVQTWLKRYGRSDDATKKLRKPGIQKLRNKLREHRLFPENMW